MMRALMIKTLFVLSILLSTQALAFDVGGLSYTVITGTTAEVTGRAAGNADTDINIPDTVSDGTTTCSVTTIGGWAFFSNTLTSVTIPDGVTTIGYSAFRNNALTSVMIPDSVTTIGDYAFAYNTLTSVTIPDNVTSIGGAAFFQNLLTSVDIPDSVTTIGHGAFGANFLTSAIIPDSVETIGMNAFGSNALTNADIPASVTSIGGSAFSDNVITNVDIPNSVTSIGGSAFSNNALTSVAFEGNFGGFQLDMFDINPTLATITYCDGTTGWPQGFNNGSKIITTTPINCFPPDAPTVDSIEPGNGEATITFTSGADNSSSITGYRYIKDDGSVTATILGTTGTNPFGIAVDAAGNVYTANQNSFDVSKIRLDGTSTIIGLADGEVRGIALDADGNVYTNNAIGTISNITPDGVSIILGARDFTNSFGVVIDAAGNFYAANERANSVTKTAPDGTSSILGITGASPRWIALDTAGNVYTPNYYSNNVSKIAPDGTSTIVGVTGINPQGIALDAAGNIYTTNAGSATVSKITPYGISTTLGATGNNPDGIAIDAAGNIYTANSGDDSVSKITFDGISTILGTTGNFPTKIALDAAGSVYTANSYSSNVSKIMDTSTVTFAVIGDTSPITITGLTNGTEYLISLIAVNAVGESVVSNSVSVTPAPTAPDAPHITNIEPGNGQVSISVSMADDGGSPITDYTAYCFGDMFSFGSSSLSPITVSGLNNGVSYVCFASATNDVGTSPLSAASALATPVAPPPGC
jgi:sugar lactone lactonase YvrE